MPENSSLQRVSQQTLWTGTGDEDWLGRPVLLDLGNGTWVAMYRQASIHTNDADAKFHLRFSTNEGATWGAVDTFTDAQPCVGAPFQRHNATFTYDGLIMQAPNGDLLVHIGERAGGGVYQYRSTDGGKNWADEGMINSDTTLIGGQDYKVVGSTLYEIFMRDPNSDHAHPWQMLLYEGGSDGVTWTKVADVEAVLDINEPGLAVMTDDRMAVVSRDPGNAQTFLHESDDVGVTWGARQAITHKLGIFQRPRFRQIGSVNFAFGRQVLAQGQRTVVYTTPTSSLTWSAPFYLDAEYYEDTGYCDVLQRENGEYYMLSYIGEVESASIVEYVFRAV